MKISELFSEKFIQTIEDQLLHAKMPDEELTIEYVDPRQFLSKNRIDLVCKLYYIECREKGRGIEFAKEVYRVHIESITYGRFSEVWNSEKNSLEKYFEVFDDLIDNIKTHGFDEKKSVIPVSEDSIILDGSHRVAAAIYFGIKVPVVRLKTPAWKNNYQAFMKKKQYAIPEKYMDFIAYQYMAYKNLCYVAMIWPVSYRDPNYGTALKILHQFSNVVYKKQVYLNYNGLAQLAMHTYMDAEWTGGFANRYTGIFTAVDERYGKKAPVTVLILDDMPLDKIRQLKLLIRTVLHDGFAKIHITDTREEALRLGKMLLNANSVQFLNDSFFFRYDDFVNEFWKFRSLALSSKLENDLCLDTGAVLAVYGIRNTRDIDYLMVSDDKTDLLSDFDKHTQQYYDGFAADISCEEIIYNWFDHFYCFDIMFSSLESVRILKQKRNEKKDRRDVQLIKKLETKCHYKKEYYKRRRKKMLKNYTSLRYYYHMLKKTVRRKPTL